MKDWKYMKFPKITVLLIVVILVLTAIKTYNQNKNVMSPQEQQSYINQLMVGIWQDSPSMAAGWGDRYHFYSDNTYSFVTAQGNCSEPVRQIDGTWTFNNGVLVVNRSLIEEWKGGKIVKTQPADVGCGTPTKLINYEANVSKAGSCTTNECTKLQEGLSVNFMEDDLGGYTKTKIDLAGTSFWKMESEPINDAPVSLSDNTKAHE